MTWGKGGAMGDDDTIQRLRIIVKGLNIDA